MPELLPCSVEAERFVLASAIVYPDNMAELRGAIRQDDFSLEKHRRIWNVACELFDKGTAPDRVAVAEALIQRGQLESVDGASYLVDLDTGMPRLSSIESYVRIVQDKAFLRRAALAAHELESRCLLQSDSPESLAEFAHGLLSGLQSPHAISPFLTPAQIVERDGVDPILHPKRGVDTVPLPWRWLDGVLGGLDREQLVIVGGRTSQGKTSAVCQVILHACLRGVRVAMFSLEMSRHSLLRKLASQLSGVDHERIRHNQMSAGERSRVQEAMGALIEFPLFIADTAARNVSIVGSMLRGLRVQYGQIGLAVVDHLHALSASGHVENRTQQISADVRNLKLMAREFNCPFVVPAQLNTQTQRENAKPTLSDLRQSGEIQENADVVWFVWLDLNDTAPIQRGEFIVAKQREGYRDISRIMGFERATQLWRDLDD